MTPECGAAYSALYLFLISLIGVAAFIGGFFAGRQRSKPAADGDER